MNTAIVYFYRDASNYKSTPLTAVFSGPPTPDLVRRFKSTLDNDTFVVEQVGLQDCYLFGEGGYDYDAEDDHGWHEVSLIEATRCVPTDPRSFLLLVEEFERVSAAGWEPLDHTEA